MADNNVLLSNMQDLGVMEYTKVGNLQVGAQLGIGSYHPNLDAATPVVFTPTVLLVLQTPTMYDEPLHLSNEKGLSLFSGKGYGAIITRDFFDNIVCTFFFHT